MEPQDAHPRRPATASRRLRPVVIAAAIYVLAYVALRGCGYLRDPGVGVVFDPSVYGAPSDERELPPALRSVVDGAFLPATWAEIGWNKFKR